MGYVMSLYSSAGTFSVLGRIGWIICAEVEDCRIAVTNEHSSLHSTEPNKRLNDMNEHEIDSTIVDGLDRSIGQ